MIFSAHANRIGMKLDSNFVASYTRVGQYLLVMWYFGPITLKLADALSSWRIFARKVLWVAASVTASNVHRNSI